MNPRCVRQTVALALVATICGMTSLPQASGGKPSPPTYRFGYTSLGSVAFNNFSGGAKAYGLSEPDGNGVMIAVGGGYTQPSPNYARVWDVTSSGVLLSTGTLPSSIKWTAAVNDIGMIAYSGYSTTQSMNVGLVEVPGVGTVEILFFQPTALNNLGTVVGYYQVGSNREGELFDIAADGTVTGTSLGDFVPFAINDSDEMAGQRGNAAAIAWFEDGVLQVEDLPLPSLPNLAGVYARGTGINNFGEVVGHSYFRPFLWSPTAGLIYLTSNATGSALDINDHGQVVGWSTTSNGYYAFLWENGALSDLNALSGLGTKTFRLGSAESINNAGHIVGRSDSFNKNGTSAGSGTYLLTPK